MPPNEVKLSEPFVPLPPRPPPNPTTHSTSGRTATLDSFHTSYATGVGKVVIYFALMMSTATTNSRQPTARQPLKGRTA